MVSKATKLAQSGIFPIGGVEVSNLPTIATTTVLFPSMADLAPIDKNSLAQSGKETVLDNFYYGGVGTPTTASLARTVAALEGGHHAVLTPSGQSAIVAALAAILRCGDHILVVDTVTYTTRWYCDRCLSNAGIEVDYYDPALGSGIEERIRPNTRAIFMESPGSMTFEIQDVPAICAVASRHRVLTILDNTWASSFFFEPFSHGVDISLLSLTKTHAAPAGISLGAAVTNNRRLYEDVKEAAALLGMHVSPDDCVKASLALSTLHLRLSHQQQCVGLVLDLLAGQPEVRQIFHPSLPGSVGHIIWQRDFSGANSLLSLEFDELSRTDLEALADTFRLVRIGYGWGGSLSLLNLFQANEWRTVSRAPMEGYCMRLYLGLEDPYEILSDIEIGFANWRRARERVQRLGAA